MHMLCSFPILLQVYLSSRDAKMNEQTLYPHGDISKHTKIQSGGT